MRALVYSRFGEPADVLEAADRPLPEPGAGQVRIKMTMAAIHNHDMMTVAGKYGYKPPLPAIGGSEAVGVVDALGDKVAGLQVGQRVTASGTGAWAEYFLAAAGAVMPVADGIPDEMAAQLIAMPLSALAILETVGAKPGEWIALNAANGAVGKAVIGFAKARGVHVLGLVRRAEGVAELGGAPGVSTSDPAWRDAAKALVGDAPVVAAVDSVGGDASNDLLGLLAEGGTLLSFGALTGEPMHLDPGRMIFKGLKAEGFWLSKALGALPEATRAGLFGELMKAAADGSLQLPVDGVYALADVEAAMANQAKPGRLGKVLLKP